MYSSRGSNAYGQQSYGAGQSAYGQNQGGAYSGSSVVGADGTSQFSLSSRHSTVLGAGQDAEAGGYRSHNSTAAHYGGQYGSVYGSTGLSGAQQAPTMNAKGTGSSALEGRGVYTSVLPDSPNFTSGDYISSTRHGYGHKADFAEKISDYSALERRQYGEQHGSYLGRDLPIEPVGRYTDSGSFSHQHQPDMYDRLDQASLLREEHLLNKAQALQSTSVDGGSRQADYLAARGVASRHPSHSLLSYGTRVDADPRLSALNSSYGGQHAPSILGAAPRRNLEDLAYPHIASNPGYGVSLPPGRDYGAGKGLHATSLDVDYPPSILSHGGHPRTDERKDDRASYLREFELREEERRREVRLRDREKERDKEKEREREREREREKLKLRDRERERERERIIERRDKERERQRKRLLEKKRERTPPRVSKDRHSSSLTKDGRPSRRVSPRREPLHRRLSPGKEKRRDYVCKVHSYRLVDVERDYLSLDKRYPRLFVSPEVSKVVVHWPKENLKLSMHTPVSFEHDFVEEVLSETKTPSANQLPEEPVKPEHANTVWNAKVILMGGLSRTALEDLSSEKAPDDFIPHMSNILRFAVLKKEHALMAIGGPLDFTDDVSPSDDDSALAKTAVSYARDVTQLDLQNCRNWNRFLEIHYDRVGNDGFFSHKEVTVLFVPDLSECLPSLETWRTQWLAHKKAVTEREQHQSLKKERSREKKEGLKDMDIDSSSERVEKSEKKNKTLSSGQSIDAEKKGKGIEGGKENVTKKIVDGNDEKAEKEEVNKGDELVTTKKDGEIAENVEVILKVEEPVEKKEQGEAIAVPTTKKKVIRRVIKKKTKAETTDSNLNNKVAEKDKESSENDLKNNSGPSNTSGSTVKTIIKKKIIKRVPKKKVADGETVGGTSDIKGDCDNIGKNEAAHAENQMPNAENQVSEVKKTEKKTVQKSKTASTEKPDDVTKTSKSEIKVNTEDKKAEVGTGTKAETLKQVVKDEDNSKKGKVNVLKEKKRDAKGEPRTVSTKELKEKRKLEEPPRPGFILQTKGSKDSKLRSLSLSLDSLLDYSDKDIDESTFELSLFAESLHEMLQYEMGSRILAFLQKLRIEFVTKRNERKRQREEMLEKANDKKLPAKRPKTDELPTKMSSKPEATSAAEDNDKKLAEEATADDDDVNEPDVKDDVEADVKEDEDDPEEDPEEDVEMDVASPQDNSSDEDDEGKEKEVEKIDNDAEPENTAVTVKDNENNKADLLSKENVAKASEVKPESGDVNVRGKEERKMETKRKKETVDKELLQAFRFFDRNQVGYVRVEDLRLVIHSLGKFLSHKDVKELVQSALLETNTGRDDHILYSKLVRMAVIEAGP